MQSLSLLPATFTTATAKAAKLHPRDLYKLRNTGEIIELSRGVFRKADAPVPTWPDLLAVHHRAPHAVVCLLSAAAVYDFTDELPLTTQIAVPIGGHRPCIHYPPTEVFQFASATFELGRTTVEVAPTEHVPIFTPERTIVDLMKFRNQLGQPQAFTALRRYLQQPRPALATLMTYAEALNVTKPMRLALDVMSAT